MNMNNHVTLFQKYSFLGIWIVGYLLSGCATLTHEAPNTSIPATKTITLAVWDFDNNAMAGGEFDYLSQALSEAVLINLSQTPGIRLLERVKLHKVLEEQHMGSSQLASEESRLKLGRISGANHMAFGSFMTMGNQIRIDVRVVDVETSQVKFSEDAVSSVKDAITHMPVIAQHIAAKLASSSIAEPAITTEMTLWKRYAEGITLMDKHLYEQAIALFTAVLKIEPNFKAAENQIRVALELQARQ